MDIFVNIKEAVVWRCSVKIVFLEISQNSQENTCARVPFLIKLQAPPFLKNTFFYWTPLVAALDISYLRCLNLILCLDLNYDVL